MRTEVIDVETIGLLYTSVMPMLIIGLASGLVGGLVTMQSGDRLGGVLTCLVVVLGLARAALFWAFHRRTLDRVTLAEARIWETRMAVGSNAFSLALGAFAARAIAVAAPTDHMLIVAVVIGYCSGLVTRLSVRPWIAISSLLLVSLPLMGAALAKMELAYAGLAGLMVLLLLAGLETVFHTRRVVEAQITSRFDLARLARQDSLTGLPNRLMLSQQIDEALAALSQTGGQIGVLCLDLDRFKEVNDSFGHAMGDDLLKAAAARLLTAVRPGDVVARVGGDEFVVLQIDIAGRHSAETLARRIVRSLGEPFQIQGQTLQIGASVGVAVAPDDGMEAEALMARADGALYATKRRGRGGFSFVEPSPVSLPQAS